MSAGLVVKFREPGRLGDCQSVGAMTVFECRQISLVLLPTTPVEMVCRIWTLSNLQRETEEDWKRT